MAEHSLLDGSAPSKTLTLASLTPGVTPIRHLTDLFERVSQENDRQMAAIEDAALRIRAEDRANKLMAGVDMALLHSAPCNLSDTAALLRKLADYSEVIGDVFEQAEDGPHTDVLGDAFCAAIHSASAFLGQMMCFAPEGKLTTTAWTEAVGEWEQAKRTYDATDPASTTDEETNAVYGLQDAVLDMPAPHFAAVIYKIEQARERYEGYEMPDELIDTLLSDIRRLAGIPEPERAHWAAAVADYWDASRAHEKVDPTDEAASAPALAAVEAAIVRLMATPAPDAAALVEKMEIVDREEYQNEANAFKALLEDARRIGLSKEMVA